MNTIDNQHYQAEKGCFVVRKSDQVIMGEAIDLGSEDSIENYEDQPYTDESYREFYASIGIDVDAQNRTKNRKGKSS
ncbi:MAG: hypothetical protein J6X22_04080 [Muribaculaceae bacterium]|nr:hypothetical protein [Muribaculaceae bacterium]